MTLSEELTWRGFVNQTTFKSIEEIDTTKRTFYFGVDPSAPSMTIGNLASTMMVRNFMSHGHKAVLLIGGATGLIGDPDGKADERNLKTLEEVESNKKAIVEEFIEGDEISVECISWQGKHYLLAITDKMTTGAPHFVELQHHQPGNFSAAMQRKIETATFQNLDALGISFGASHSEFKITVDGEIFAIETGARMGGDFIGSHLVPLSTGYDFLKGVLNVALNEFIVPKIDNNGHSGVYFLAEESAFLLPYFSQENSFDYEKKKFNKTLSKISNSNDRSGYLIYRAIKKIELQ